MCESGAEYSLIKSESTSFVHELCTDKVVLRGSTVCKEESPEGTGQDGGCYLVACLPRRFTPPS